MNRKGFLGRLLVVPFVGKVVAEVEPERFITRGAVAPKEMQEVSVPFVQDRAVPPDGDWVVGLTSTTNDSEIMWYDTNGNVIR